MPALCELNSRTAHQWGSYSGQWQHCWQRLVAIIGGSARVSGGLLTTPRSHHAGPITRHPAPGLVRLGVNGKLNLTGDGTPLTGNGLLDTTTNTPNSVEYTGKATTDLLAAEPAFGFRGLGLYGRPSKKDRRGNPGLTTGQSSSAGSSIGFAERPGRGLWLKPVEAISNGPSLIPSTVLPNSGTYTVPGVIVKVDGRPLRVSVP